MVYMHQHIPSPLIMRHFEDKKNTWDCIQSPDSILYDTTLDIRGIRVRSYMSALLKVEEMLVSRRLLTNVAIWDNMPAILNKDSRGLYHGYVANYRNSLLYDSVYFQSKVMK